ncbi:Predicted ATPase [Pedococcus cremeus]|uniref:Predicted ATPase n=1 Tax=Pedococcus cremeus TaxID=587636 RepID=A0A1H9XHV1_9MICO|nr:AAA family ATPase [Pedococcus cremeus]SES45712.1 Predicted ATPase [Pedococcus cremeus]
MTHIESFTIHGLAGRTKPVSHELQPDVNVFFAGNGAGKTSLLKILHSALSNDSEPLHRVPFESAEVHFVSEARGRVVRTLSRKDNKEGHWETLWDSEAEEPVEVWVLDDPTWQSKPKEFARLRFRHGYLPISRISEGGRVGPRRSQAMVQKRDNSVITEAAYDKQFAAGIEDRWRTYATEALVQIREAQEYGLAEVLDAVLRGPGRSGYVSEVSPREAYAMVREFFGAQARVPFKVGSSASFIRRYEDDQLLREIVARIEQVQERINKAQEPQRRLEALVKELFAANKEIHFKPDGITVEVSKAKVPLESLSSGERQLLLLMLECLRATNNVVIIDEPELSMHIDWQHRLVSTLQTVNTEMQLVMATHSPEVMAEIPDKSVHEL